MLCIFLVFRCTKYDGSSGCSMNASSYNIIPPVVSSRLITKNHRSFLYGNLEVIAKFPTGDWIVPGKLCITYIIG